MRSGSVSSSSSSSSSSRSCSSSSSSSSSSSRSCSSSSSSSRSGSGSGSRGASNRRGGGGGGGGSRGGGGAAAVVLVVVVVVAFFVVAVVLDVVDVMLEKNMTTRGLEVICNIICMYLNMQIYIYINGGCSKFFHLENVIFAKKNFLSPNFRELHVFLSRYMLAKILEKNVDV